MAIGLGSAPERADEAWTKELRGCTYTFTIMKKGPHHFVYSCARHIEDSLTDSGRFFILAKTHFGKPTGVQLAISVFQRASRKLAIP